MTSSADRSSVENVIQRWVDAVKGNDVDEILELVTPDFELIPPGQPAVAGAQRREAIRGLFDPFDLEVDGATLELVVGGDVAVRRYRYEISATPRTGGAARVTSGHGIHVLRREEDGSWKFWKDIWTEVPR